MILNGQYIENESIGRTEYKESETSKYFSKPGYAEIIRKVYACGQTTVMPPLITIYCTKEEYEIAIMYLERDMNK